MQGDCKSTEIPRTSGRENIAAENETEQNQSAFKNIYEMNFRFENNKINPLSDLQDSNNKAQEPWPNDVKLFQPYEVEQILLPDNANCLAVQAYLKMCSLNFEVEPRPNAEAMSPSGKVPFIKVGRFVVSELDEIVKFVGSKGLSTLTDNLDSEMKADLRAYMSLVHNVLELAELYICWCDKETYNEVTSVRNGSIYPWPLNHIQNRAKKNSVIKELKVFDWYNKSMQEVFQEVESCCQALSDRLEDKTYFFGDHCELDALLYGHIYAILTTPLPACHNRLAYLVQKFDVLVEHCQRINMLFMNRHTDFSMRLRTKSNAILKDDEIAPDDEDFSVKSNRENWESYNASDYESGDADEIKSIET